MSTLLLNAPKSGETITYTLSEEITGFDFSFPTDTAIFEKVDDEFHIYIEELDATIILDDFYAIYHEEFMPSFVLESEVVAGEDFFAALNPDLMPALGLVLLYRNRNAENSDNLELADGLASLEGTLGESEYEAETVTSESETSSAQNTSSNGGRFYRTEDSFSSNTESSNGNESATEPSQPVVPSTPPLTSSPAPTPELPSTATPALNEAAEIISFENLSTKEDSAQSIVSGKIVANDDYSNGNLVFSVNSSASVYGDISIKQNGEYIYTLNNKNVDVDSLKEGEIATESFTIFVTDENGLTTPQIITVTITGTNDAPTLSAQHIEGHEDDTVITGQATASDVDNDAVLTFSAEGTSEYGIFTIDPTTGKYTFTLNENAQNLGQNEIVTENFTITVTDEYGASSSQEITVTINGESDTVETLIVDNVTDDNILNTFEASGDVAITGKVEGDYAEGDKVTVEVNGKFYEGSLEADGSYSVNVSGNELSVDHEVTVTVEATDADGIKQILTETKEFTFKGDPLADDFVSINEGASVEGVLFSADEMTAGLLINSINAPEGWNVVDNGDGSYTLTYEVGVASKPHYSKVIEGTYTVEISADGTFTYTGPTVYEDVVYENINSIIDLTVVDQNGVEYDTTVTFANNAATQDNLLIDGDFIGNTVEVTNRDSNDNTTYKYTTADYSGASGEAAVKLLSGFFLGDNNDTIEVTGTVGYGDGKAHHLYGDELDLSKDGGHDEIIVGELASGGHIRGDGNVKAGLEGGDDVITVGTMNASTTGTVNETTSRIIGDGWTVEKNGQGGDDIISVDTLNNGEIAGDSYAHHGQGGDDTLDVGSMTGGTISGDGHYIYSTGVGGDDTINVDSYTGKGYGKTYITGDGHTIYAGGQGGDDTINIGVMDGQTVYGDALNSYGKGGNDTINIDTMKSGSVVGDGSASYSTASGGNDTIKIKDFDGGTIYGDGANEAAGSTAGNDSIEVGTMSSGNIYADNLYGTLDDGGNDTVSVEKFDGNGDIKIDGGLGNDTFIYDNKDGATIDFSTTGKVVVKGSENANITNFENLSTGSGNDLIKVSSSTLSGNINAGEGFDVVYSTTASMEDMLAGEGLSNVEMLITGGNLNETNQESMLEDLGITQNGQNGQNVEFSESWTITGTANGGSIYSNGETEVWVKDPVNAEAEIATISENSEGAGALIVAHADFDAHATVNGLDALEDYSDDLEGDSEADDYLSGDGSSKLLVLRGLDDGESTHGGAGDTIIKASEANDILIGGEGGDIFSWDIRYDGNDGDDDNYGDDTIKGFTVGEDTLDLTAFDSDEYDISAGQSGNDSVITISKGGEVQLEITLADVAYSDGLLNEITVTNAVSDGVTC